MTEIEVAESFPTLKHWRWTNGMRDSQNFRLLHVTLHDGSWMAYNEVNHQLVGLYKPLSPDLKDAATIGCILSIVRSACNDDSAYLCDYDGYDSVEWAVVSDVVYKHRERLGLKPDGWMRCLLGDGDTEAKALYYSLVYIEKEEELWNG
jgi:hypothetical protein